MRVRARARTREDRTVTGTYFGDILVILGGFTGLVTIATVIALAWPTE